MIPFICTVLAPHYSFLIVLFEEKVHPRRLFYKRRVRPPPFLQLGTESEGDVMKRAIFLILICVSGMNVAEAVAAGWLLWPNSHLNQLRVACNGYYNAVTDEARHLQLRRASAALRKLKKESWISEQAIVARLNTYKQREPKSVAVVILAMDTYPLTELAALYKAVVTPSEIEWANQVVRGLK